MKLSIAITLDGLVRALRWKEHDLMERVERNALAASVGETSAQRTPDRQAIKPSIRMTDNERSGR